MADALRTPRVVVVGAGIGGLVSALLLAHRGLEVTLVEAAAAPGGKMRQVVVDGAAVDSGPTVFTMRWVLDQKLAEIGSSLDSLQQLSPIHVLARHAWRDSPATLDLHADTERSADATRQIAALVKAIQTDTQDAAAAMERSTQGVVEGTRLTDKAGSALGDIDRVSRQLADLIMHISSQALGEAQSANVARPDLAHAVASGWSWCNEECTSPDERRF